MAFFKVGAAIAIIMLGWTAVRAEPQALHALFHGQPAPASHAAP